jgi:methionyl-tRNA formyltransferase
MRIVFAGTPEFARRALLALLDAGHEVPLVLTQPDRKSGRGMRQTGSPVKQLAEARGLNLFQPEKLNGPLEVEPLRAARPDVLVVAAYGLILPPGVLAVAPMGALNIHASLLPRWRGAAPIQRALLSGDRTTGISIMQMERGLDTGPVIEQSAVSIDDDETAGTLHDKLAALGASMIVGALDKSRRGSLVGEPQPGEGVTYAHKILKREAALDWRLPARDLDRVVRAFNPVPGAQGVLEGTELKVWRARSVDGSGEPGLVQSMAADAIVVACGTGALALTEVQRAGGKRLPLRDFLLGHPILPGSRFALPAD